MFADGHVRVLELREDKLSVEEALYRGLMGGTVSGTNELSMDDLNFGTMNEDEEDWDEEDEDWVSIQSEESEHREWSTVVDISIKLPSSFSSI